METTSKYYTPDISEFHVEFEYENDWSSTGQFDKAAYRGQSLTEEYSECQGSIEEDIRDGLIRVKYLDREDIEELGFILYKSFSECDVFQYHSNNTWYELEYYNSDFQNEIWIDKYSLSGVDIFGADYNSEYVFKGVVKNKSALKVLLKQLGIL